VRVVVRASAEFTRQVQGDVQRIDGHFTTYPQLVATGHSFDFDKLVDELNSAVDNFNSRGSGFILNIVSHFTLLITQYRPLSGSSYIPTPPSIAKKRAVINVKNNDQRFFLWSLLSCLYQPRSNATSVYSYTKYQDTLNFDGLTFPIRPKDIPKFEKQNPEISVNVISLDPENKGYCIEFLSPEHHRPHHINLLLIHDPDSQTSHYVWIKNFSRLLHGRTKSGGASFVCNSCLNVFSSQRVLNAHIPNCLQHAPQQVLYPPSNDCKLSFKDHDKQHPFKFYCVCDFESFLKPADNVDDDVVSNAKTHIVDEHRVSGYCCYRVTDLDQYQTPPVVYSGDNPLSHFYEHIASECEIINEILSQQIPLSPMSDEQLRHHRAATVCANCNESFTHDNYKVKHHCHVTGDYLFPACNRCNLQLKPKKCKGATTDSYLLNVVFHNLSCYDGHFIIKNFQKQYVEKITKRGKISYDDIKTIPINGEKFLQFQIGNVRFLDSYHFLPSSLDHLVTLLLKSGKNNFKHTTKYLGSHEFVYSKGIFPYNFMTDRSKFSETQLPPIEDFYNALNDEPLSVEDYQRARRIWDFLDIKKSAAISRPLSKI